jgi:hypothetical protein
MTGLDLGLYAIAIGAVALLIMSFKGGLPWHTNPIIQRALFGLPAGLIGIYLIEHVVPKDSNWSYLLIIAVYGLNPLWLFMGNRKADAEWRRLNEVETERKQEEAARQADLQQKQQQLAEENATYAPLGATTSNPTDITDTAKRIADELKKR